MAGRKYLTQNELQEAADEIMHGDNDEVLSNISEEIPEMFSDSGSSYKPSSASDSSEQEELLSSDELAEEVADISQNENDNGNGLLDDQGGEEWLDIDSEPNVFDFSEPEGLKINISPTSTAKEIFELLFDNSLVEKICVWVNLRAQSLRQNNLSRHSTMNKWKPTDPEEFFCFIGLCILMGNISMPSIKHYWSTNTLYYHPIFGKFMSRNRFESILRCLCFYKSNDDKSSRLHKIAQVLDHISENIRNIFYPGRNLSLDEALLLWRGRLVFRQYIPNKSAKYGIKLYELCTPDGFVLEILIYSGKGTVDNETSHAQSVVTKLAQRYLGKGHTLYLDNYYNSVQLAEFLYQNKTHVVGTLRKTRKGNPKHVISSKLKKKKQEKKSLGRRIMSWC